MDETTPEQPTTRRKGFGTGLRLAAAGAATLAALPAGTAAADDWDDDIDELRARSRALAFDIRDEALRRVRERLEAVEQRWDGWDPFVGAAGLAAGRLYRVNDVNGDDFDRGSDPQNRDPLTWGAVRLVRETSNDARIQVALDGAAANVTYEVVFLGIRDNRVGLGWVRTNQAGDFEGLSRSNQDNTGDPRRLGGGNRVGVFVLTRDGKDQFLTALPTRVA